MSASIVRAGLTEKQLGFLKTIRKHQRKRGVTPALKEIASEMGVSASAVGQYVKALEKSRKIFRPYGFGGGTTRKSPRAIKVLVSDDVLFGGAA